MKPRIVQDTPYGDYRDNLETSQYTYKLDLSTILYNLTDEDCSFILSTLYKNILFGEDVEKGVIYNTVVGYDMFERRNDRMGRISMQDKEETLPVKCFLFSYSIKTKHFTLSLGYGKDRMEADASAVIMIYEYLLTTVSK